MDGIIVASDQTLEWMLPWWWEHYRNHNSHPVAFIDLGLSFEMKEWCKERGELIPLRIVDFTEEVAPQMAKEWEKGFGTRFWGSRDAWFKKPLACLKSPFDKTIWIDTDCEVRGSLTPLFEYADKPIGFAMAKEKVEIPFSYESYNSGIIVFRKNHPILKDWADACLTKNQIFRGDQDVISHVLGEKGIEIDEVPPLYNWSRCLDETPDVVILHWHGTYGKYVIKTLWGC